MNTMVHNKITISLSAAALLALASPQQYSANAAIADKENEVESILNRMVSDALLFRDEIIRAYRLRCETETLTECARNNYNDCSSTFPNQQCMKKEELVVSACGDGESCNALWDKSVSTVSIPQALADGPRGNPSDQETIESACYSRLAERYMAEKYAADEAFWAKYGVQPMWTYFGAHNGLFRKVPAIHQETCGVYDHRRRPWFVAASSGPKDVVLVIDTSGSMDDYGRMDLAKDASKTIIDTLTVADRVAIVSFSDVASQVGGYTTLIRATSENKQLLKDAIDDLVPNGATNFYDAFETAFDSLDSTISKDATTGCNVAVLFMTDGQITVGPSAEEVIGLVNERTEQFAEKYNDRKATIFTFSLGYQADHDITKRIACSTNGVWTPVDDFSDDLVSAMGSYYKLFALGLGEGGNEDFAAWVEPYEFANPKGKLGTTVAVPVYDRSVSPALFLGVVAVDMYMAALEQVLGEDAMSSTMLKRFIMLSTARCPKLELTECELDALRFLGGGEEATCGMCNSTSYTGIVPEKCPFQSDLPNNLWQNTALEGKDHASRACCGLGSTEPDTCPAGTLGTFEIPSRTPSSYYSIEPLSFAAEEQSSNTGVIVGVVLALVFVILAAAICFWKKKGRWPCSSSPTPPSPVNPDAQGAGSAMEMVRRLSSTIDAHVSPVVASAPPTPR